MHGTQCALFVTFREDFHGTQPCTFVTFREDFQIYYALLLCLGPSDVSNVVNLYCKRNDDMKYAVGDLVMHSGGLCSGVTRAGA